MEQNNNNNITAFLGMGTCRYIKEIKWQKHGCINVLSVLHIEKVSEVKIVSYLEQLCTVLMPSEQDQ